jgi:hypothetical protein
LTGLNFKKLTTIFFAVLLVFTMLQAKDRFARTVVQMQRAPASTVCRFISSFTSEKAGISESSSEICPQTISQRSEFKKIFHFNFTTLFQVHSLYVTRPDLTLMSRSFPAVPLYISHCTILI